ncbi:MAG: hypothetical protein ASARMPRED_004485 [Alectoria sarmentosa]|nr:MAG: hypothetical protein ASARMPRED_004485 [Alectoria sarmentosa]
MQFANFIAGAAVALPALCLGAPIKAISNNLNQRVDSMSSDGPLEVGFVVKRGSDATRGDVVEIRGASVTADERLAAPLERMIKRESDTDEVSDEASDGPGELGIFI